jgi:crescentin
VSDLEGRRDDLTRRVEGLETALTQERAAHAKLKATHLDAAESHRLTASNLREELGAMASRSEAAEKLLAEARGSLREREAEIRGFEQRTVEGALAVKSKDAALADVEKDLASARASHAEVDAIRATLNQRSAELAKASEAKSAALQRAEQKIVAIESRVAEQNKAMETEREELEARLAKLKEQLEAEQAARSFVEGALQAARQERGSRRRDAEGATSAAPKEPPTPVNESARDKITRLRG